MRILKAHEVAKLNFRTSRTKHMPIYLTAAQLAVGESLLIEHNEWAPKGKHDMPALNKVAMFSQSNKKFTTKVLTDNAGFVVTRIQ